MHSYMNMTKRLALLLAIAAQGLAMAGCSKDIAEATGMATTAQESKPFVKETRRADADYIPVNSSVTRTAPRKLPDEFKKLETDLEAKRISNEAAGTQAQQLGSTPPPAPAPVH
ncbi:hypothetical protein EV560_10517 [Bosea sp. BK604]|nr:hypothetical protein EV560_10517 [Bosea sp. BK604]